MFTKTLPVLISNRLFTMRKSSFSNYIKGPHNYINGARVFGDGDATVPIIQPSCGKIVGELKCSGVEDVNAAIYAAKQAHSTWSKLSGFERGKFLRLAASLVREKAEFIAQLEVFDTGKPIWEARADILCCANALEFYGAAATTLEGSYHQLPNGNFAHVIRESLGVVCGIGAWNYPFQVMTWKSAPALAAGNTIAYKPSEHTALTSLALAEIYSEAGIPPGVVNVIQGDRKTGELLCKHRNVAKVSFTGSVPTGQSIMKMCSEGMKRVTLELGGKSPLIVFDDADLTQSVKATMMGNFLTQGEVCTNCTRVFVQRSVYDQFVNELVAATKCMKIGNPMAEDVTIGATITKEHATKVLGYISKAKEEGCLVRYGGERVIPREPELADGYYLSPCILTECSDELQIVKEEVFGAVVTILPFDTEEEAIKRANNTKFGLAAGIMTKDLKRGHRVSSKLEAGIVWINNYNIFPNETPFGGYKFSGFGRENGIVSLNDYTQTKTIYVEMNEIDCPIYKL